MATELLTTEEAAKLARVTRSVIHKHVRDGYLKTDGTVENQRFYFDRSEVCRWIEWRKDKQRDVQNQRQSGRAFLYANGMPMPGQLECERQDIRDRERLFLDVHGENVDKAVSALCELYYKYGRLRLPLEEQRLGCSFGGRHRPD